MKGYLKKKEQLKRLLLGAGFTLGDLGVIHENGYIQLKDRSKDIIISGGENISSIEIEEVLYKHPSVVSSGSCMQCPMISGEKPHAPLFNSIKKVQL